MDKRTATLTLTEKLRELGYINLVSDTSVKSYLLDNAKSVVLDFKKGSLVPKGKQSINLNRFGEDSLGTTFTNCPKANYFFTEGGSIEKGNYAYLKKAIITPVALIGEIEERVLKETFYKDMPDEMLTAFKVLNIPNFLRQYEAYSSFSDEDTELHVKGLYFPFKEADVVEIGDIIQGAQSKRFYLVDKIKPNGDISGKTFKDVFLKTPCGPSSYNECNLSAIIPIKKNYPDYFFNFVFTLPYEDQNITANKVILKSGKVDFCRILLEKYSKGRHFQEYFQVLDEEKQKLIVDKLKDLPEQNKFLNSWLFNQGFILELDYLDFYMNYSEKFIKYFSKSTQDVQELIVSDIFSCGHINQEVIDFLEKDYPDLLRDMAFKEE